MIVLYAFQSFMCKLYTDAYPGRDEMASPVFTVVSGGIVALSSIIAAALGGGVAISCRTLLIGLANAVALVIYNYSLIRCIKEGPYSVIMVFSIAGGIIIPVIASATLYSEIPSIGKVISILLLIVSVYLVARKDGESYGNKKRFFIACFALAVGNGLYGMLLKVHEREMTKIYGAPLEQKEVVAVTYFFAMLLSLAVLAIREKRGLADAMKQTKKSLLYLVITAFIISGAVNLLVFLIPLVNLAVLYTVDNSGVFLLSVILSCIFFKERLTKVNAIGCVGMCTALVLVAIL